MVVDLMELTDFHCSQKLHAAAKARRAHFTLECLIIV